MPGRTVRETRDVSLHLRDQLSSHPRGPGQYQLLDTRVTCSHTVSVMLKAGPDLYSILERGRSSLKSDLSSHLPIRLVLRNAC